jgi:HEAT repeat protein
MSTPDEIPFKKLVDALLDVDTPLNPSILYRLSDMEDSELEIFKPAWFKLPLWRRQALMEDIEELGASDYLLDFTSLSRFVLSDEDPGIRLMAVRTLWEYEHKELVRIFLDLLDSDDNKEIRAAATSGLGRFVYAGEIDKLPSSKLKEIEDVLLQIANGEEAPQVRRAALESLGYSSREEVPALIEQAFKSDDRSWKASALFAMGRSANQIWKPQVMSMLESSVPLFRAESARAAGELELSESVPFLLEMLDDPDDNARSASIWALSQLGGEGVREALEAIYDDAEDDEDLEYLESALENLAFTEGVKLMPLFDFPDSVETEEEEDEWYEELEQMDDLFDDEEDPVD